MRGKKFVVVSAVCATIAMGAPVRAAAATLPYRDISKSFAKSAIVYTASTHDWLEESGGLFHPAAPVRRWLLARALAKAFAPSATVNPAIRLRDVRSTSSVARYANIVVSRHWMSAPGGDFRPTGFVGKAAMDIALVRAAGLSSLAARINQIRTSDGYHFRHSSLFGYSVVASQLGFHYNYPNAAGRELLPATAVERADLAYALKAAARARSSWRIWNLQGYDIVLPPLSRTRRKVVEFAIKYAEYPYVYAGESSHGFDCSGFVWWVLRRGVAPASPRGYRGWSLPQRTSFGMAEYARPRVTYSHLRPLDVILFDADGANQHRWQGFNHAAIYLGNGWFIHSSGSRGGVSIDRVDTGWWHDAYGWARHVIPSTV